MCSFEKGLFLKNIFLIRTVFCPHLTMFCQYWFDLKNQAAFAIKQYSALFTDILHKNVWER